MTKVLFVGDKPSAKNLDPELAFVGTLSHKTLMQWVGELDCSGDYRVLNSHTNVLINDIFFTWVAGYEVVALGNNASSRLTKAGITHFKLPHPSPKNRQLNKANFIKKELIKAKQYLKGARK